MVDKTSRPRNGRDLASPKEAEVARRRKALNKFAIENAYNQTRSPLEYEKRKEKLTRAIRQVAMGGTSKSPGKKVVP